MNLQIYQKWQTYSNVLTGLVPGPPVKPEPKPVSLRLIETSDRIFCDLETSGFGVYTDTAILQLSAVCGDKMFDNYIDPPPGCKINSVASDVTNLRIQDGRLTHKNWPVQSKTNPRCPKAVHSLAETV